MTDRLSFKAEAICRGYRLLYTPAAPQASKKAAGRFINERLQSALRICSSFLCQMMARSGPGRQSKKKRKKKKGGWIKSCWSLPITARVGACSYYRATLRSLPASRCWEPDGQKAKSSLSAREKSQSHKEEYIRSDTTSTAKTARTLANSFRWH